MIYPSFLNVTLKKKKQREEKGTNIIYSTHSFFSRLLNMHNLQSGLFLVTWPRFKIPLKWITLKVPVMNQSFYSPELLFLKLFVEGFFVCVFYVQSLIHHCRCNLSRVKEKRKVSSGNIESALSKTMKVMKVPKSLSWNPWPIASWGSSFPFIYPSLLC